jgi:hypothetical protein
MHFDTLLHGVVTRFVPERPEVKIGAQLAVDTREEIQIERGGDSKRIVVGFEQLGKRFFKICAEEERIARKQYAVNFGEKTLGSVTIEIADRAAEKKHEQTIIFAAPRCGCQQTVEIGALKSDNADALDAAQFTFTTCQRGGRNFNRAVSGALAPREGLQQPARLLAAAASQFRHQDLRLQAGDDVRGMALQEPLVGAR